MKRFRVGLVGATGIVGQTFIRLLDERNFPVEELRPFASKNSLGKQLSLGNRSFELQVLHEGCFDQLDFVFFSSGDEISLEWGPKAVAAGAWAIDNSAAFRLNKDVELVVPEINHSDKIAKAPCLIANPNCSTIQLVMFLNAVKPLGIKSVRVASYQAVSGAGRDAIEELNSNAAESNCFRHAISGNCLPEIGSFDEQGISSEERKIRLETKKILNMPELPVSAFTVRVPVENSHAEAVWVEFDSETSKKSIIEALSDREGLVISDTTAEYHTQKHSHDTNPVYVSRIHQDPDLPNTWLFWVVADNLRKGAALNGLQIAEKIAQQISQ